MGELMMVLKLMNDNLCNIVSCVCFGIDIIYYVVEEIVSGNLDLLVCIEQQVGFIEEIVVVMEELIFIVRQNVDNVCQVIELVGNVLYIVV